MDGFKFEAWPTDYREITQPFGARPDYYAAFGLPGHEGVDIRAPIDTPIYAVADGTIVKVSDKREDGKPSAYGWHVVIEHADGYSTLYGHLREPEIFMADVGDKVLAGYIIGYSGNTGISTGAHLHLTLKKPPGDPGWPWDIIDPTPFLDAVDD